MRKYVVLKPRKRKPTYAGLLASKPAPWGPTVSGPPVAPDDVAIPDARLLISRRGCDCGDDNWYRCPREKVNLRKETPPESYWLYYKCASCGLRWNPWPPGNPRFLLANKAIGTELMLDVEGDRPQGAPSDRHHTRDTRVRLDISALRYDDNDAL